jgi:hypothetical protein
MSSGRGVSWWRAVAALACALGVGLPSAASAQEDPTEQAYAAAFGAGLQAWAESNYVASVMHMSRAYGLKPNPAPLRMVVRSYDMMGHCSAALQQQNLLELEHGVQSAVALQRCARPARLTLSCEMPDVQIVVDRMIRTTCGTTVLLPEGAHEVVVPEREVRQQVNLLAGQARTLALASSPRKWAKARGRSGAHVPRILDDAERYTVYMSRDGLYQIWVRHDAPDLLEPYGKD